MQSISRRQFTCFAGVWAAGAARAWGQQPTRQWSCGPPAYSIDPVVGDGRWIWTEPPSSTGYLEPREFEVQIGVELEGRGRATRLMATTPVPTSFPEQRILKTTIARQGCTAAIRRLASGAAQLVLAAPSIVKGQRISAVARLQVTLFKQYHGFSEESFPASQVVPRDVRQHCLGDSPGIQSRIAPVRWLAKQLQQQAEHPWQLAQAACRWVRENIRARHGQYTSVEEALENRVGDCEERAATFVAVCRAAGIAARLVWVPNHNWAEFYLQDAAGRGHWIPAHTAAYSWFGWTGAHELVLQKGDRIKVPEKSGLQRLVADWAQWQGTRPAIRTVGELTPAPSPDAPDGGPGARRKQADGRWTLINKHPLDSVLRDGAQDATDSPSIVREKRP